MKATVKTIRFQKHHDVKSLREVRVYEPLRGSDLDPRVVIVKSDGPKRIAISYFEQPFIRSIANLRQKLMRLVVRIKVLLRAPGAL